MTKPLDAEDMIGRREPPVGERPRLLDADRRALNRETAVAASHHFVSSISLITTVGPMGLNVMAAEWTLPISYDPFLIATFIGPEEATHRQIVATGEFGVNVCSDRQLAPVMLGGFYSRRDVDKLTSGAFEIYPAKYIRSPMLDGCLVNAECRLYDSRGWGDHTAFVGEVLDVRWSGERSPMVRHRRGFYHLGGPVTHGTFLYITATPGRVDPGEQLRLVGRILPAQALSVAVELRDPVGRVVVRTILEGRVQGHYGGTLQVPYDIPIGKYLLFASANRMSSFAHVDIGEPGGGQQENSEDG